MSNIGNAELLQRMRDTKKENIGYQRVSALLDEGSFHELGGLSVSGEDLTEAAAGYGTIQGCPVYCFGQNSDIAGGAMSKAQAAKIEKVYAMAAETGLPVVGIYDSIGGRLKENGTLLTSYGNILRAANRLSGVVPQIAVILGPCIGTTALIAASADFVIMSDHAELTVSTAGEGGAAQEASKLGLCQIQVSKEEEVFDMVRRLISMLPSNNLSPDFSLDFKDTKDTVETYCPDELPSPVSVITAVCDDSEFVELSKEFGCPTVTGLGLLAGCTVGMVAFQGTIGPDSCEKAAKLVRFCDAFSLPVVTFVDAEKFTTIREASKLSSCYTETTAPKISVIMGSAVGTVYVALCGKANSDYTLAWPDTVISSLAPQTEAVFLWKERLSGSDNPVEDRRHLIEEYRSTQASSFSAAASGLVEDIIFPQETRSKLIFTLEMLSSKRVSSLPKKHSTIQV